MAERTCIVSRSVSDPDQMIRFVMAPDGSVVADLKRNLPGRGVWVTASRAMVDEAVKRRAFARGFKRSVAVADDLGEQVDALLAKAALGALGFARKAGECVTGAGKVETALRRGNAIAILHAAEAAEDGIRKLAAAARSARADTGETVAVFSGFSSMQLSLALGAPHVIHAALTRGGAARNCLRRIADLAAYRGDAAFAAQSGAENSTPNNALSVARAVPWADKATRMKSGSERGKEGKDVDE